MVSGNVSVLEILFAAISLASVGLSLAEFTKLILPFLTSSVVILSI